MTTQVFWRVKRTVSPPLTRQPLKGLYLLVVIAGALIRLPYWLVVSAIPATRHRKRWSFARAMQMHILQYTFIPLFATLALPTVFIDPKTVDPAKGTIWIDPTPEFVAGEIKEAADVNGVEPARVIGYMQFKKGKDCRADEKARLGEKIIYHLHGGGYIWDGVKGGSGWLRSKWLEESPSMSRAFQVEFRLASHYGHELISDHLKCPGQAIKNVSFSET
ncbi:uncharacterized protein PHACADRAFT_199519 [Phanerochaete carnosa HHB-10118-sp]|uniref:Alpha/beta hydrolase fold-3 domain-containing protein n=1 Tax=Phanerochaete carnosa (strain HHB-10118-sp) TaxID=650164 RepID=K5WNW7_PHACS|nr:uncharacterized protein PHACADRAFT_199519 [Phanerochaete carnosa HHB-10118-sp]EKM52017.1 hypothetical protein PHACADRAFT_199519 [Phanerochaete carnosa HHB-10118-sp]